MLLLTLQTALPAQTWASCDVRADALLVRDADGDGFGDACVRIGGGWLVARTVEGWKASGWRGAESFGAALAGELDAALGSSASARVAAPPYEPGAVLALSAIGDLDGDGDVDVLAAFRCSKPGVFLELRATFAPGPDERDRDGDGVADADEARLGSDPLNRDSDGDGLLDGWEVNGLPRGVAAGNARLDPAQPDVICAVAPYEGIDRAAVERELAQVARLYAEIGVRFHWRMDASVPAERQAGGDWGACGALNFAPRERGVLHWMQVTPGGGGQAQQTGDMGGCGQGFAVFAHEFGHQLSLSHTGDSEPAWCPLYTSLMNYAYSYGFDGDGQRVHFSRGALGTVELLEDALDERLPFALERVAFLGKPPFRFSLQADGDATRIDWNHDGHFSDEPVSADINYGSATSCGTRRDWDLQIGAAPALAYVGERAWLATLDLHQYGIAVREYLGEERWGEPRTLPDSASQEDFLMVGWRGQGWVLARRATGWLAWGFDSSEVLEPAEIAEAPNCELSGVVVGDRLLLLARASDDTLVPYWIEEPTRLHALPGPKLELTSQVPVGLAVDPVDGRIVLATSATGPTGRPLNLRVSRARLEGDALIVEDTQWVRGASAGVTSSTRPALAFDRAGQLNLFHTEAPQKDGSMVVYRTRAVGNRELDGGWLVCMLYDIWTRTRRPVTFAAGPQGALYAFRWDAATAHGMRPNELLIAHNGFGVEREPMRDFDDGAKIRLHGLAHSILWMQHAE